MVIHDRSYSRWDGDRTRPVKAVPVILESGIKRGVATLFRIGDQQAHLAPAADIAPAHVTQIGAQQVQRQAMAAEVTGSLPQLLLGTGNVQLRQ